MRILGNMFGRLALFTALVGGVSCNRSSSPPEPGKASASNPSASAPQGVSLDDEAMAVARTHWDAHISSCGDTYVARAEYRDKSGGSIEEYTNVKFSVQASSLTEADRLNAIEWDGIAEARGTSRRGSHFSNFHTTVDPVKLLSPNRTEPEPGHSTPGQWSAWEVSGAAIWALKLRKTGGAWSIAPTRWGDTNAMFYFEPWPCADRAQNLDEEGVLVQPSAPDPPG